MTWPEHVRGTVAMTDERGGHREGGQRMSEPMKCPRCGTEGCWLQVKALPTDADWIQADIACSQRIVAEQAKAQTELLRTLAGEERAPWWGRRFDRWMAQTPFVWRFHWWAHRLFCYCRGSKP